MKKTLLGYILLLCGMFLSSCIKQTSVRTSMDVLLKATIGIRKDIGTAD
ncbi:hypothetical protein INP83_13390 [Mucilaginibacter sp. 21P]|nr:hypothetical protein [Mucilaginibacter sp. 21P]QXV64088.1 hypothetical protein INP83_13390 [Mucilaginibacter sp. 21P]